MTGSEETLWSSVWSLHGRKVEDREPNEIPEFGGYKLETGEFHWGGGPTRMPLDRSRLHKVYGQSDFEDEAEFERCLAEHFADWPCEGSSLSDVVSTEAAWFCPAGVFYACAQRSHDSLAKRLVRERKLELKPGDGLRLTDSQDVLLSHGWAKVTPAVFVTAGTSYTATRAQLRQCMDLLACGKLDERFHDAIMMFVEWSER